MSNNFHKKSLLENFMNWKLLAQGKGLKKLKGCSCARKRPVVFCFFPPIFFLKILFLVPKVSNS